MTSTMSSGIEGLRAAMAGVVCGPGEPEYEQARRIWNGDIDRHPAVVARCTSPSDVAAALACARELGLEVSVRGGGHGYSGSAVCDGGVMIDLSPLDGVRVDPDARRAWVGGGAQLADLDAATQAHGLAAPAGVIGHTGVAGLGRVP
jgi:FAD/FMN-containing dehydrogenase